MPSWHERVLVVEREKGKYVRKLVEREKQEINAMEKEEKEKKKQKGR